MSLDWGRNHQLSFGNGGMPNGPCTLAVDSLMSLILSGISIFGNANCSANHRLIVIYVRGIVKTLSSVEIKSLFSFIINSLYSDRIFWKQGNYKNKTYKRHLFLWFSNSISLSELLSLPSSLIWSFWVDKKTFQVPFQKASADDRIKTDLGK